MAVKLVSDEIRFWRKVDKAGPIHPVLGTRCWEWTSGLFDQGYGQFHKGSRITGDRGPVKSHRFSYELVHGKTQLLICHHCDNRKCVNPAHLFAGTCADNHADRNAKGRQAKGTKVNTNVLTEEQAKLILKHKSVSPKFLAKLFNVSVSCINHIRAGHNWKHLRTTK